MIELRKKKSFYSREIELILMLDNDQ